jgi:hypothetical protein
MEFYKIDSGDELRKYSHVLDSPTATSARYLK